MAIVLTFEGVHAAIAAEKKARAILAEAELVPLPASIKSDCGFGLLIPGEDTLEAETVKECVARGVAYASAYRLNEKEGNYERID
jgi:Protein of unknown function (DUF3343).